MPVETKLSNGMDVLRKKLAGKSEDTQIRKFSLFFSELPGGGSKSIPLLISDSLWQILQ